MRNRRGNYPYGRRWGLVGSPRSVVPGRPFHRTVPALGALKSRRTQPIFYGYFSSVFHQVLRPGADAQTAMTSTATTGLSLRTGTSQLRDPVLAAKELFDAIQQPDIKLAVFYCASDFDLPALASALREHFGNINLIGCTTAGEITPQGYLDGALTGFSLAADDMLVETRCFGLDPFDSVDTSAEVTSLLGHLATGTGPAPSAADCFGFLLVDGLSMQEEMVVSCIHQHLRGIDLIGGSAADDVRFGSTHLYHQGQFHQRVALLTVVRTSLPFVAFRTQHFVPSDKRMVVTGADPDQRVVYEINGLPAAHEYAKMVGLELDELTPLVFASYPVMVRVGGQYFVRSIAMVNPDGGLQFFCAIDEGIVLTIATGVNLIDNLQESFASVREQIGAPQLVLGCDCVLRRIEMERDGVREQVGQIYKDNNVIGFATYGEQFNAMHVNQTFTGIAIGRSA